VPARSGARNIRLPFPYPGDVRWWDYLTERIDHKISDKNTSMDA